MKAKVDKDTCIGCGLCTAVCPSIFRMDDDGKSVAKYEELSNETLIDAREAESQCPVGAISIE